MGLAGIWDRVLVKLGYREPEPIETPKRPWLVDRDGRVHTDSRRVVLKARGS